MNTSRPPLVEVAEDFAAMKLLYSAKLLAPAGTGSTSLNAILARFSKTRQSHDHLQRMQPNVRGNYAITIRDPVERLVSGWKYRTMSTRSHKPWVRTASVTEFIDAFLDTSHAMHTESQRVYWNSVLRPLPPAPGVVVQFGDPFLVSQVDYLRNYDPTIHRVVVVCTERLSWLSHHLNNVTVHRNRHDQAPPPMREQLAQAVYKVMYPRDTALYRAYCGSGVQGPRRLRSDYRPDQI